MKDKYEAPCTLTGAVRTGVDPRMTSFLESIQGTVVEKTGLLHVTDKAALPSLRFMWNLWIDAEKPNGLEPDSNDPHVVTYYRRGFRFGEFNTKEGAKLAAVMICAVPFIVQEIANLRAAVRELHLKLDTSNAEKKRLALMLDGDTLLTAKEAAKRLNVSEGDVKAWVRKGRVSTIRVRNTESIAVSSLRALERIAK